MGDPEQIARLRDVEHGIADEIPGKSEDRAAGLLDLLRFEEAAFWAADLPRSSVRCTEDRAQQRWPAELAELLVHATTTVPVGPLEPG